jgi:hypothetical protein
LPSGNKGNVLSPRLERVLIENIQAMERNLGSVNIKAELKNDLNGLREKDGPITVNGC